MKLHFLSAIVNLVIVRQARSLQSEMDKPTMLPGIHSSLPISQDIWELSEEIFKVHLLFPSASSFDSLLVFWSFRY